MAGQPILIAHSLPAVRLLIWRILDQMGGLSVLEAADGETALEMARRLQPGLLLMSPTLPKVDGVEVCRRLKADPVTQAIPVIIVSGGGSRDEAMAAGADGFLPMPFTSRHLTHEVRHYLQLGEPLG